MDQATDTRITPEVLARLREWEGRSETLADDVTAAPVRGTGRSTRVDTQQEPA